MPVLHYTLLHLASQVSFLSSPYICLLHLISSFIHFLHFVCFVHQPMKIETCYTKLNNAIITSIVNYISMLRHFCLLYSEIDCFAAFIEFRLFFLLFIVRLFFLIVAVSSFLHTFFLSYNYDVDWIQSSYWLVLYFIQKRFTNESLLCAYC